MLALLYRTVCQFSNRLEIKVLPPVAPDAREDMLANGEVDAEKFAARVQRVMAGELGLPMCAEADAATVLAARLPPQKEGDDDNYEVDAKRK